MAPRKNRRRRELSLMQIFAAPLVIASISSVGLVAALLGDDLWDVVSWVTLGITIVPIAWFAMPRRKA